MMSGKLLAVLMVGLMSWHGAALPLFTSQLKLTDVMDLIGLNEELSDNPSTQLDVEEVIKLMRERMRRQIYTTEVNIMLLYLNRLVDSAAVDQFEDCRASVFEESEKLCSSLQDGSDGPLFSHCRRSLEARIGKCANQSLESLLRKWSSPLSGSDVSLDKEKCTRFYEKTIEDLFYFQFKNGKPLDQSKLDEIDSKTSPAWEECKLIMDRDNMEMIAKTNGEARIEAEKIKEKEAAKLKEERKRIAEDMKTGNDMTVVWNRHREDRMLLERVRQEKMAREREERAKDMQMRQAEERKAAERRVMARIFLGSNMEPWWRPSGGTKTQQKGTKKGVRRTGGLW